jgi:imidazolonepropionase-like amidohydrolase
VAASFVIRHARIFDGHCVLPYDTVHVSHGVIAAVGKDAAMPVAGETIDGSGHTLLPGLIDAHTHSWGAEPLRQALVFGVTTELDMFMDAHLMRQLKRKLAEGDGDDLADLRSAGICATAPEGHGTEYGFPIPTLNGPEEARAFVEARVAEGSDYIKIILDARAFHAHVLDVATMAALVQAAHALGKLAIVHIVASDLAWEAITAGADGLAHLYVNHHAKPGFAEEVAARGAFVIPTLAVLESLCGIPGGAAVADDRRQAPYLSNHAVATLRQVMSTPAGLDNYHHVIEPIVRQLQVAGVPVLAGTDAPNPGTAHGASLHRELELLVQAGLRPIEALAAATSLPAAVFGLADRGRIAPGQRADLLLVAGDPTRDITATRAIARVWKRGLPVDRDTFIRAVGRSE